MDVNWLITGGCGFIGSSLVKRLINSAVEQPNVRVFDNLSVGQRSDLPAEANFTNVDTSEVVSSPNGLEFLIGDVCCEQSLNAACVGIDAIVHLAANTGVGPSVDDPRADFKNNVIGTFNVLEAARKAGTKRLIMASSGAPVGEAVPPIHEEMAPHPVSPYGASKLAGEGYCSAYFRTFGLETVALRFGNVYGPGSGKKNSVVAKFISNALDQKNLEIYGDGTQTRDFIYIDDLITAITLAAQSANVGGEVFQIATNSETSVLEVLETIKRAFKSKNIKFPEVHHESARVGDVLRNYSDTSKAGSVLGWTPNTPLDVGIDRTLEYFLEKTG